MKDTALNRLIWNVLTWWHQQHRGAPRHRAEPTVYNLAGD